MPDDASGGHKNQGAVDQVPIAQSVNPPLAPNDPYPQTAERISDEDMKREVRDIDDRLKRAEKWMIGLTGAIALFALGSIIVGILQWNVMNGQLGEMKSGGVDTKNLASAAASQAEALKLQEQQMENNGETAKAQSLAAIDQAGATQDEVRVSRDALQSVQRAFVTFQQGMVAIPISDSGNPPRNTAWEFGVRLENSGTTPTRGAVHRISWIYFPRTLPDDS